MKFVCLGYVDLEKAKALTDHEREAHFASCMKYDEVLKAAGHTAGGACLGNSSQARTLRQVNGKVEITEGSDLETSEQVGGLLHLEARDIEQAVELISKHPGLATGSFEIRPASESGVSAEEEIRALIAAWSKALDAKDVDAMMTHYLEDAVLFDAIPPYKTLGRDSIAQAWRSCMPYFPEVFRSEHRDLTIEVDGDLAFVFGLHHFCVDDPTDPAGETWMRVSIGLRRRGGTWKVAHEHFSIPFNPMTNEAWKIPDPDKVEAPDYSAVAAD